MTPDCVRFDEIVDQVSAGAVMPPDLALHLDGCAECQARRALAERLEHALATWPVATPRPDFATSIVSAARRDAWAQEVVIDWGFNLAVAGSLAAILGGIVGLIWTMTAAADATTTVRVASDTASRLMDGVLARAPVVGAATLLLTTALGGWWWAEQPERS